MNEQRNKDSDKSKVFKGFAWKFGERITAQVVSMIVAILLARLLSPNDYGAVSIVMIFITIANVFVSNGFGLALIQKKNADNCDFSTVFFLNVAFGILVYFIVFLAAPYIAVFFNLPILAPALRVLGIRIILASINSIQQAYISRNMLFEKMFWSTLFGTLLSGVVGILMAYRGYGVWALIIQYLVNTTVDTCVLWFTVRWRPQLLFSAERAKNLFAYGWKLLISALLDTGYVQLRSIIVGKKYTSSDLAYYTQGDKYPSLLVTNINAAISSVIFPALSKHQSEKAVIKNMVKKALQVSSYILWPLMVGIAVVAEPLISLVLTDKWLPCVPYLRIFCFTYALWPIHTANLQAIAAMGRSDIFLKLEIIKKTIGIVLLIISCQISPFAMAVSVVISDVLGVFINSFPNSRLMGYKLGEQFKDVLPAIFISVVMVCVILPIRMLNLSSIVLLFLQAFVGLSVYVAGSFIIKPNAYIYVTEMLRERRK